MPSSLSLDLRSRIASAVMAGETVRSVAVRFGVCAATAVRLGQKARAGEDLKARRNCSGLLGRYAVSGGGERLDLWVDDGLVM